MTKIGRNVSWFIFSIVLFGAVLIASLNLPAYYEARFTIINQDNLIEINNFNNLDNYIDNIFGPITINKYFIPNYYDSENSENLLSRYALVKRHNDISTISLYSQNDISLKTITQDIINKDKNTRVTKYKEKQKRLKLTLHQADNVIENLKSEFLSRLLETHKIERNQALTYINNVIEQNKIKTAIANIEKLKSHNLISYLTISVIKNDKELQKLITEYNDLEANIKRATVKISIDNRIKAIISNLNKQIIVNEESIQKYNHSAESDENIEKLINNFLIKLQIAIEKKSSIINEDKILDFKIQNIINDTSQNAIITKHKLFNNFCHNLLLFLASISIINIFGLFSTEKVPNIKNEEVQKNTSSVVIKSINDLLSHIDNNKNFAFFAEKSDYAAAKFILELRKKKYNSKIILLSFNSKIINSQNLAPPGLVELLLNQASLTDIIFKDNSCNVDILYCGNKFIDLNKELLIKADNFIKELNNKYDYIVFNISDEPLLPIESFLKSNANINVISSDFNDHIAKKWYWILQHLGYNKINYLNIKEL